MTHRILLRRALSDYLQTLSKDVSWSLSAEEWEILKQVRGVLEPFYDVTNQFQATLVASISLVHTRILMLKDHLSAESDLVVTKAAYDGEGNCIQAGEVAKPVDTKEPVKQLKEAMLENLESRWGPENMMWPHMPMFKLAAALDPRNRRHTMLKNEWGSLKALVKRSALTMADELADHIVKDELMQSSSIWEELAQSTTSGGGARGGEEDDMRADEEGGDYDEENLDDAAFTSRVRKSQDWSDRYYDDTVAAAPPTTRTAQEAKEIVERSLEAELGAYFGDKFIAPGRSVDPVVWWRGNKDRYPVLSKIAILVLVVPCTSAGVERFFSAGGNTITRLRTSLDPERVNKMLSLQQNWDDRLYFLFPDEVATLERRRKRKAAAQDSGRKRRARGEVERSSIGSESEHSGEDLL